jgi:pimeloyl-ACP methyl ester carboxylesterase
MSAITDLILKKSLTPATLARRPDVVTRVREMIASANPQGAAAALRGMAVRSDHTNFLASILAPTLIMVGSEDQLTPPSDAELMRREIRGSRLVVIPGAAHVSNLERPAEFNHALTEFLRALQP